MTVKILHVITSLARGGAENMLYKLVESLSQETGFSHEVICLTSGNQFDFDRLAVPVHHLGMARGFPSLADFHSMKKLVYKIKPDVIHGWMYHANIAAVAARANTPIVWGVRHSLDDIVHEKILTKIIIYFGSFIARWRRIKKVIYCSQASRVQHERLGYPPNKSVFIPNGFDCVKFSPQPNARAFLNLQYGFDDAHKVVGIAARYHPIKNHAGLIRAFKFVVDRLPMARLLLCGKGLDSNNLVISSLIDRCNLTSKVFLLDEQDDMPRFFSALDVNVLCSYSEGFPNVLGEAMACGVQCVTTDAGGAASILGGIGKVVPIGEDEALAEAIVELLTQPQVIRDEQRRRARMRIQEEYSLPMVAERYASVYRDLC